MTKKNKNNSGSMVLVDAELLSQGLKTAFTGIAMVFDSLGASGAADEIKAAQEISPSPTISAVSQGSPGADENNQEEAEDLPLTRSRKHRTSLQSLQPTRRLPLQRSPSMTSPRSLWRRSRRSGTTTPGSVRS